MARPFLSAIDLNNNEVLNMILQNVATLPATGKKVGYICYLTTENEPYILVDATPGNYVWEKLGGTTLSLALTGTQITLTSSTGNSVVLPAATVAEAGLLTATLYSKLMDLNISNRSDLRSVDIINTPGAAKTAPSQQAIIAYVEAEISSALAGLMEFKGGYKPVGSGTGANTPELEGDATFIEKGDTWVVTAAGTLYGTPVEAGDVIIVKDAVTTPRSSDTYTIVNKNIPAIATGTSTVAGLLRIASGTAGDPGDPDMAARADHGHAEVHDSTPGFMSPADKAKLDGLSATNYAHPNSGVGAGTYRSVTVNAQGHVTAGANPTTLAGYGITDAVPSTHVGAGGAAHANVVAAGAAGFMSGADKTKLDGIAANANNYSHPAGDGNLHVPATGTTNNGKVLTAGGTAGSLAWTALAGASATVAGLIELATQAEVDAGTDAVRAVTPATLAGRGFARKFFATLATSAVSIVVNHLLSTRDVIVQAYYAATYEHVECDVVATDANNVTLSFATAPAANSIRVCVIG